MHKITEILLKAAAITAGALIILMLVRKNQQNQYLKINSGKYTSDMFKKIIHDMNKTIAATEKRLAKHDKLQKMYEKMEWKICNN